MTPEEWNIVCEAKSRGIISGNLRDDGTFFYPDQKINRAEAMKIVTLGILKSLDKLDQKQFDDEQGKLERAYRNTLSTILYPDVGYDAPNKPFWFAVYVSIANSERIIGGYPDGTFRPANEINNAEAYRVIVETGARASDEINRQLSNAKTRTAGDDWFKKYAQTLSDFDISYSTEYGDLTTRKEFMILVMGLLRSVGL
ncbi:MAG: S-layer homology domain-containing protein [Candidatus Gracilibacteria bacterium]|nr:S-layer homology domain-containing protein [Candidatus Gracilibacteria bacterium]